MRPTRRTQPHRRGPRQPGPALDAMKRGTRYGDIGERMLQTHRKLRGRRRRRKARIGY